MSLRAKRSILLAVDSACGREIAAASKKASQKEIVISTNAVRRNLHAHDKISRFSRNDKACYP